MNSNIDKKVFENCGQELYDSSLHTEYRNIEQKMLNSSLNNLQTEITIIENDIHDLKKYLNELNSKYSVHNTFTSNTFSFLFTSGYNGTLYQIQAKIKEIKEELDKKNRERSILFNDIITISSQLTSYNE
jgi:predicted  nucleic acid-binding Zn-ribbon protein